MRRTLLKKICLYTLAIGFLTFAFGVGVVSKACPLLVV